MGNVQQQQQWVLIDGDSLIAGRVSSVVAKMLLEGKKVIVVNADKVLVSGDKGSIVDEWKTKLEISSVVQPKYGPFHPRRPDTILARMVRGMLPIRRPKGAKAFKNLRVYIGAPEEFSRMEQMRVEEAKASKPRSFYHSLGELASEIGWHGEVREG